MTRAIYRLAFAILLLIPLAALAQEQPQVRMPELPASVDHPPTHPGWIVNEHMAPYPYPNQHVSDGQPMGGTLRRGISDDPDSLNPITANDTVSSTIQSFVLESLAGPDPRNYDNFIPYLAEWWETSPDHMEYLIHMRHGVMWEPISLPSGAAIAPTEVTADDAVFYFQCVMNPVVEGAHLRSYYTRVDRVEALDRYTVHVVWREPYYMALDWSLYIQPLPRNIYGVDENGTSIGDPSSEAFGQAFNQHWMDHRLTGTGQYRFLEWERGQRFTLERNPDYWGAPGHFDRVDFRVVRDDQTRFLNFTEGEFDFTGLTVEQYLHQTSGGRWASGQLHKQAYYSPGYRFVGYNLRRPMFRDALTRRALTYAIPREEIIRDIMQGLAEETTGPFYKFSPGYDSTIEPYPYDPDEAQMMLFEAGWEDSDGDGILDRVVEGTRIPFEFELMIYAGSPTYENIAVRIRQSLERIGIRVRVSPVQWANFLDSLDQFNFDACILGWSMGASAWKPDPYQLWHSSFADQVGSSNFIGWRDDRTDALMEQIRVTFDDRARNELYHQFHRIIHEEQPYTFLFVDMSLAAWNDRLRGVEFFQTGTYNTSDWYIPQALQ